EDGIRDRNVTGVQTCALPILFRSFKSYASGELVKHNEQDKVGMGHTLYIGSLKSEVYFCCYEKNYEQYAKLGIPLEEAPIKNRRSEERRVGKESTTAGPA